MLSEVKEFIPRVKAEEGQQEEEPEDEEDLVDPVANVKENCAETTCSTAKARLDECNERVISKTKTSETCFEEVLDFYHCVDHCAAPQIFHHVK
ncbi:cytochrome b-c1 complex subunit 6, mitochondrial [Eurytemora carolleeae]|uniref:cytochrome b-c1 complex subunit 6, mitochondrial n=1 Tax=Eurytemora carolleeae TaxID=1294199 RepID=UPI000C76D6A4|nr:cytochrome b-c1 complex subunit 6, mitochondrial [Eurytemora carolleeae]|eukprot:XP_023340981.1 cytochrome b-c1 complex subunit 6, mitochondrial-like [Eurytemora affinis]